MWRAFGRRSNGYGKTLCDLCLPAAINRGIDLSQVFDKRLSAICAAQDDLLYGGLKGVEKESLRVASDGSLAQTPHPEALGSALTNRFITTDFSEALLEFVTPAYETTWEALHCICDIHQFTYSNLGDEMLWAASMPCLIPGDDGIPLARYGTSNVGRMKTIYRRGLGHRYGRQMQTIAGVHFNYSVPGKFWSPYQQILGDTGDLDAFRSDQYLGMIRNVRREGWIILYLFGASPAVCKSFAAGSVEQLDILNNETRYAPFATSLRMSDIGYNNQNQSRINISLNSLEEYVRDLGAAVATREPSYEDIGVKVDGEYQQLNANLLQIENEFYSPVRPKRVANSGERPTAALQRGGIEYVEIRSLDINLFDPCGISQNTMRFMEAFLLYCLLSESPLLDDDAFVEVRDNQLDVARRGRDPELRLRRSGDAVPLNEWANEIMRGVAAVASVIDEHDDNNSYGEAVSAMQVLVEDPNATPSARMVRELEDSGAGFFQFAHDMSGRHRDYFASIASIDDATQAAFRQEAIDSLQRQAEIEAGDSISLDEYLKRYFGDN